MVWKLTAIPLSPAKNWWLQDEMPFQNGPFEKGRHSFIFGASPGALINNAGVSRPQLKGLDLLWPKYSTRRQSYVSMLVVNISQFYIRVTRVGWINRKSASAPLWLVDAGGANFCWRCSYLFFLEVSLSSDRFGADTLQSLFKKPLCSCLFSKHLFVLRYPSHCFSNKNTCQVFHMGSVLGWYTQVDGKLIALRLLIVQESIRYPFFTLSCACVTSNQCLLYLLQVFFVLNLLQLHIFNK